ncbi:MAG: sugar transferase [Aristaeellaceae bacterium]
MCKWEELPPFMRMDAVRPYYDALCRKRASLVLKRMADVLVSALLLVLLSPVFLLLAAAIRLDSPGPVFFRQVRVTQYGREFRIFKFRTMVSGADRLGSLVTIGGDSRVTRVGRLIRRCRLDETAQLIDVLRGTMTLVGTRPEVPRYVAVYTPEMMATLLLPAGVTSEASICFRDEEKLLNGVENVDDAYIRQVLPRKMRYNLRGLREFSLRGDIRLMARTVLAMLGREKAANAEDAMPL